MRKMFYSYMHSFFVYNNKSFSVSSILIFKYIISYMVRNLEEEQTIFSVIFDEYNYILMYE
jgi:hypothetical protein